jgi:GMP synthase-like glutamine amidotransferase
MGGPMSVNDPNSWIQQELGFIQSAMSIGIPILGICLGAQFLARALGGSVRPGSCFEIGMVPITLNSDGKNDPLFHTFPTTFEVFQWHGEGLDLPEQAVQLASSKDYEVQAFRFQEKVYGLLFHLEMEEQGVHVLCRECVKDVERSGVPAEIIKQEAITRLPHLHDLADKLIGHLTVPPNF